jgi:hypothetical protein
VLGVEIRHGRYDTGCSGYRLKPPIAIERHSRDATTPSRKTSRRVATLLVVTQQLRPTISYLPLDLRCREASMEREDDRAEAWQRMEELD